MAEEGRWTVVWLYDNTYMPQPVTVDGIELKPLSVRHAAFEAAAAAYLQRDVNLAASRNQAVMAIQFASVSAGSSAWAIEATRADAERLAASVGYRQYGSGPLLGWLVLAPDGGTLGDANEPILRRVQNLPLASEQAEILSILAVLREHPQGLVFAQLFAEACQGLAPEGGVTRLWTILEALSEEFMGDRKKLEGIRAALVDRVAEPNIGNEPLLTAAYRLRNRFVHSGVLAERTYAESVRLELTHLVWFILRHAGFRPIDPASMW